MSLYDSNKILQHIDVLEHIEQGEGTRIAPVHVRIEPTEACNFQCRFCWTQDPDRLADLRNFADFDSTGKRRFEFTRLMSLVDELADLGSKAISFVAVGDPLVFPAIEKVISHAQKRGMKTAVTSNFAMKLKDDLIDVLARCVWLRWSMNGGSKEVYLNVNQPRSAQKDMVYERVLDNIKRIIAARKRLSTNVQLNASYVVSIWNAHDVFQSTKLACDLGLNSISFRPDMGHKRQDSELDTSKYNKQELLNAMALSSDTFNVHVEYERQDEVLIVNKQNDVKCFYSNHSIYIAANGDVYPCCYTRSDKKYVIGNISNQSFSDFWLSSSRKNNYNRLDASSCPSCPYVDLNRELASLYSGAESASDMWIDKPEPDTFV